jgi:hypothetical protein
MTMRSKRSIALSVRLLLSPPWLGCPRTRKPRRQPRTYSERPAEPAGEGTQREHIHRRTGPRCQHETHGAARSRPYRRRLRVAPITRIFLLRAHLGRVPPDAASGAGRLAEVPGRRREAARRGALLRSGRRPFRVGPGGPALTARRGALLVRVGQPQRPPPDREVLEPRHRLLRVFHAPIGHHRLRGVLPACQGTRAPCGQSQRSAGARTQARWRGRCRARRGAEVRAGAAGRGGRRARTTDPAGRRRAARARTRRTGRGGRARGRARGCWSRGRTRKCSRWG